MNHIKNFEDLRDELWEERQRILELLHERLHELDKFERGGYKGRICALDDVLEMLRRIIKYGD